MNEETDVNWLIENDVFDEDLQPLIDEIQRQGMKVKVQKYRPFDIEREDISTWFDPDDCVVFYGSIGFARQIQRRAPWVPGVYCTWDNYRCTHYYPAFGDLLLNSDYVMLPFGELARRKDFLLETMGEDGCIFVRPDRSEKIFKGQVIDCNSDDQAFELFALYQHTTELYDLCVVSSPKNILTEWRLVVVDDQIVAGSEYLPEHVQMVPNEVHEFARLAIKRSGHRPDTAWVLDICRTAGGDLRVLEVGAFGIAGLYACDPEPIVTAVSAAALSEWKDINGP